MTNNEADNNQLKPDDNQAPAKSRKRWILENVVSLGLALLLVFMIRSSVIEPFKIPSGSMIPTLFIGDHIFVNKFAYGLKVPFSDLLAEKPVYLIKRSPPQKGDIIVFMFPKDESIHYIKRVVGTPGDVIEIRNKMLYVNGAPIQRVPLADDKSSKIFKALDDPKYSASSLELFNEHIGSTDHVIMHDKSSFLDENRGPITVPPESLFVMGDNRDFSNDSRFWGFVPLRNVKGKAVVIWLSLWVSFSDSQFVLRPERIGTILH
jgi:signal peptidase I